jgi:hypothetical protein
MTAAVLFLVLVNNGAQGQVGKGVTVRSGASRFTAAWLGICIYVGVTSISAILGKN